MSRLSPAESAQLSNSVSLIHAGLEQFPDCGLAVVLKPDAITWNGKVHPVADLFPPLNKTELTHMADSIKLIGLQEPVVLMPDGTLLDGLNRVRACKEAGVDVHFRVCDTDNPLHFILAMNIARRHLNSSQRAIIAVGIEPYFKTKAKKRQAHGKTAPGRTLSANRRGAKGAGSKALADVVEAMNKGCAEGAERVSLRMVERASRVKKARPDLADKVRAGVITLGKAEQEVRCDTRHAAERLRDEERPDRNGAEMRMDHDMQNEIPQVATWARWVGAGELGPESLRRTATNVRKLIAALEKLEAKILRKLKKAS